MTMTHASTVTAPMCAAHGHGPCSTRPGLALAPAASGALVPLCKRHRYCPVSRRAAGAAGILPAHQALCQCLYCR
jgi:hypothetical protein